MKILRFSHLLAVLVALLGLVAPPTTARAASWNEAYGMSALGDQWLFSGSGVANYTIANIRSNYLWYVTSAAASGAPRMTSVNFDTDMTRPLLDVWVATNTYTLPNTGAAGTNVLSISTTNGLGSADVVVVRNIATDSYQFGVVSNNSAFALVTYTAFTNGYAIGDKVYKMARVQTVNPVLWNSFDNSTNPVGSTLTNFYTLPPGHTLNGRIGVPLMVGLFCTNPAAAWLNVSGEYYQRPIR